jgi:catechol 2,3-dioxygenase-like lactoylglutathione lyase family enzyme
MSPAPSQKTRIEGTVLDHIAHAVPQWHDVWHRYATDLGAEWNSGGPGPGSAPGQLRFANGARVEVLMPWDVEVNDFLSRFLAANGPGPHHLTFKVPDLADAIERVRAFGIEPIGIDFSHPEWLEAFLHPKLATGVVVQLAEEHESWSSPAPDDYPTSRRQCADGSGPVPPGSLLRVCHVVADLDSARALFAGVLGGRVVAEGTSAGFRWVDLAWPGPLGVRLVGAHGDSSTGPVTAWLGVLPGRIHHIAFEVVEPEGVPGAVPATSVFALAEAADGTSAWEIDRDANAGLGLVLLPSGTGLGATPDGPVA